MSVSKWGTPETAGTSAVEYVLLAACRLGPWWWKDLATTAVAMGVRVIAVADERRINDLSIFGVGDISARDKNEKSK